MSSRGTGRKRSRLSRAEIKAYESRRAAERARISRSVAASTDEPEVLSVDVLDHSYTLTRDDEFQVIKSDLIRLLWIVALLVVALAVATVLLN